MPRAARHHHQLPTANGSTLKQLGPTGQSIGRASQAPGRRELWASTGLEFSVVAPDPSAEPEDARPLAGESTPRFVCRLASQKAASVAQRVPQPALVIGCDTIAEVDGHILGKPRDRADARRMLQRLSGRRHSVWSGLCLIDSVSHRSWTDWAETQLDMRPLGMISWRPTWTRWPGGASREPLATRMDIRG